MYSKKKAAEQLDQNTTVTKAIHRLNLVNQTTSEIHNSIKYKYIFPQM